MKIGIFIPIYFRELAVERCLNSLLNTNIEGLDVFICLGVNGASKKFKFEYLKPYSENNPKFSRVHIFDGNKNFGKPVIINTMAKKYNEFDYLVSLDSDMCVLNENWLKDFINIFENYKDLALGALCANQTENNCHFAQNLSETLFTDINVLDKKYTLVHNKRNVGVAGGVLFTSRNIWNLFGGYAANNIYGSDDGHFAYDCYKSGFVFGYVTQIPFFHPFDNDELYSKWKVRASRNSLMKHEENGYFENRRL